MKHLKEYAGYVNKDLTFGQLPDDVISDLGDICLELTDQGFFITPFSRPDMLTTNSSLDKIIIYGNSNARPFQYDEVSEVVDRIKDYMRSKEYIIVVSIINYPLNQYSQGESCRYVKLKFQINNKVIIPYNEDLNFDEYKSNYSYTYPHKFTHSFVSDINDVLLDLSDNGIRVHLTNAQGISMKHELNSVIVLTILIDKYPQGELIDFTEVPKFPPLEYDQNVEDVIKRIRDISEAGNHKVEIDIRTKGGSYSNEDSVKFGALLNLIKISIYR